MQRTCHQCQIEMVTDCKVSVESGMYGFKVSKKQAGLFNKAQGKLKGAVCPQCGYVAMYIDEYQDFRE